VLLDVVAQTGNKIHKMSGSGYSGLIVIIAAVMGALIVFLTAGVVALVFRQLRRGRQYKLSVNISQVTAPGFENVRTRCSTGLQTTAAPLSTETTE